MTLELELREVLEVDQEFERRLAFPRVELELLVVCPSVQ
jgi:hypothetical protein